jgi:hypothetical protein
MRRLVITGTISASTSIGGAVVDKLPDSVGKFFK